MKFGGDALLLLFDGPGHAARAARSAACMRATLREIGAVEAAGARIRLRMSVGVHSDRFHLFLAGEGYREPLPTGPGWTTVMRMERASPERARSCSARRPRGRFRRAISAPPRTAGGCCAAWRRRSAPRPGYEGWRLDPRVIASTLPSAVSAYAADGAQAPEHRVVTVAFVQFGGADALIAREGADAAARELSALVRDVAAAAEEHRVALLGSDVAADGGKFMLTAGAPTATDDPEERMLLTLRRIVEREGRLTVRAGVNRGPTFASAVGPARRKTYTTMGDATNLAARLCARAEPGTVWATAGVLERSATAFETAPLEPFAAKGKRRPVHAWAVGPALGREARAAVAAVAGVTERFPLVGRAREIALLGAALADARDGRGRLVEIVSEPGLGKTRLLEEPKRARPTYAACARHARPTPPASRTAPGTSRCAGHSACLARPRHRTRSTACARRPARGLSRGHRCWPRRSARSCPTRRRSPASDRSSASIACTTPSRHCSPRC